MHNRPAHAQADVGRLAFDWTDAVVYQVYLRSFRDGDGDGVGDLVGLREGLSEIAALGCDGIWINPCFTSPQRDHGYDISDYRTIDPAYGTLDDFDAMLREAHALGLRVLLDMVANHCSTEHRWFQAALCAGPGSPERARFYFRDGRGPNGESPPNNWQSVFGGPAWTRMAEVDGQPGQWYLHAFDSSQPDLNGRNSDVAEEFEDVLRFWFERGVDGFRIDVAHGNVKAEGLPDLIGDGHNYAMWNQPEVHDIYRAWRALGDTYAPPKYFVGEVWLPDHDNLADYLRTDELHQAFDFDLLVQPWSAEEMKSAIDAGMTEASPLPARALSNHDVHRSVTRYGQQQSLVAPPPTDMISAARRQGPADLELGGRRARAAAALLLALPGSAFLYQGEELGLPEVFDLPDGARQDPIWLRSDGAELGRDGCRVPLPWSSEADDSFGFSPPDAQPSWLPQPQWFAHYARSAQQAHRSSTLNLYRALISARRGLFGSAATLSWMDSPDGVLAFIRGDGLCAVNFTSADVATPLAWPVGDVVVATSETLGDGVLPGNCAAWFTVTPQHPWRNDQRRNLRKEVR